MRETQRYLIVAIDGDERAAARAAFESRTDSNAEWRVDCVADGPAAAHHIANTHYDAIVADDDLVESLGTPPSPIVAIASADRPDSAARAFQAGVATVIVREPDCRHWTRLPSLAHSVAARARTAAALDAARFERAAWPALRLAPDGRILRGNAALASALGLANPSAVIDRHIRDLLAEPDLWSGLRRRLKTSRAIDDEPLRLRHVDGGTLHAVGQLTWIDARGESDGRGGPEAFIEVTWIDRTPLMAAKAALRESERRRNESLADDLTGDFVALGDGLVIEANRAFSEMLRADPAESPDIRFFELFGDPDDAETLRHRLRHHHELRGVELQLCRRDGQPWTVIANLTGEVDADGELVHVRGYLYDDSRRKALEGELREARRMGAIGRLTASIAHDFNNLLTVILGASEAITDAGSDRSVQASVQEIRDAGRRAARLTRQLLDFSRRRDADESIFRLGDAVAAIRRLLDRLVGPKVHLELEFAPDLPPIRADRGQVEQVLMNLVANARDAIVERGIVRVATAAEEPIAGVPRVALIVSDNGTGVPEAVRDRIFEPFFTTKPKGKGTGLGLATVRNIVEENGGDIRVHSEPGQGSRFIVRWPAVGRRRGDTLPLDGVETPVMDRAESSAGASILIAEDDELVRRVATTILRRCGFRVVATASGVAALEAEATADDGPFDLLLADVVMPELRGDELARRLLGRRPEMKVLLMSGYPARRRLGFHFIQKPFTPERLQRRVEEALHRTPTLDAGVLTPVPAKPGIDRAGDRSSRSPRLHAVVSRARRPPQLARRRD